jgi:hypothetical protein
MTGRYIVDGDAVVIGAPVGRVVTEELVECFALLPHDATSTNDAATTSVRYRTLSPPISDCPPSA